MKKPVVFSLVRDQSMFMTIIMSLMTFLAVIALGAAMAIGTAAFRWNAQWDLMATVQVMPTQNDDAVQKILNANRDKIASIKTISDEEMSELMRPWLSGGASAMKNYIPKMYEIKLNKKSDMTHVANAIGNNARFLTHANALRGATNAGVRLIMIAGIILALAIGAIGICISYIARNIAQLHHRELEILNQVGAHDEFIARQMQIIVGKISLRAAVIGFCAATPMLLLIIGAARTARVGMMSMIGLGGMSWLILIAMIPIITVFAIWITRRTTLNILKRN